MGTHRYRTALVTGASSGIGRALSRWFAARGVRVYAAARRRERLELLQSECPPGALEVVDLDVADADRTVATIRSIDQHSGGLDLVIANAGVGGLTPGRNLDWDEVARTIDVNVKGAAATLSAAVPGMVARGRGHLVGISSVVSTHPLPANAAYGASKAFLDAFLGCLRIDLRRCGVQVTCIRPGFVTSEMTNNSPMPKPFILDTDDAAQRIGKAIVRGARTATFPWPYALAMGLAQLVPNALYERFAPDFTERVPSRGDEEQLPSPEGPPSSRGSVGRP